ncbi:DMT family transporter [Ornithinimicrobium cryptoxanthini]|uniref:DMT family transporter n=1 Tax=Ornithinimicrobium cryptoxanthini TaxID=2934161 RepID=A0ABY4YL37_9MICO|nr:DMT family transporter [Ornithinimicrobium cryptoxanthini]USQ77342.1 DMT family transporter [Ornithinimicrobium cryptoxanthini]
MTARTEPVPAPSGFGLLVVAGLLWGTGGVSGAALAESSGLSAPAVATFRLALGGGLLVLVLLARRRWLPRDRHALRRIAVTGVLVALFQATYFGGVALASVSIATLVTIGSAPMIVVLVQSLRRRRMPTVTQVRPLALGVAGLGLLVGGPAAPGTDPGEALLGILLALCAGASFAFLSMVAGRPHRGTDAPMVTGYGFLFGGLLLAACTVPFAPLTFEPTARNLALVAFFAIFPTALAWTLYFGGLAHAGPAVATVVALLEPLTATVLAVLLLGEAVTVTLVSGGTLLLLSVVDARPRPVRGIRGARAQPENRFSR